MPRITGQVSNLTASAKGTTIMRRFLGIVLLGLVSAAPVAAQQPALPSVPQSLSLKDAVNLAIQNNPAYRQAANDVGPANWGVRNAYAAFLPSLSLGGGIGYTGAGSQNFLSTSFTQQSSTIGSRYQLSLNWQLSGVTLTQPGVAKAQRNAAEATADGARINLRANITQQYLAVLQAEAQVGQDSVQVKRNEEYLRLAQARYQVGQATVLDVRQAQVAKGQSDVKILQDQQAVTVQKLTLFQDMGVPAPEDPSVVTLTDTFTVVQPHWTLHGLLAQAESDNPDLVSLRARASAARWSARATRSEWLPTLNFSAGWSGYTQQFTNIDPLVQSSITQAQQQAAANMAQCQYANDNWLNAGNTPLSCDALAFTSAQQAALRSQIAAQNSAFPFSFTRQPFSASLSISLPIFTQFGRPMRVAQASAQAEDAQASVEARRLAVRTGVSQAYYALQTAYQTIATQDTNRVWAQEGLRLATEKYRVGSGTFYELLDAQVTAQQAEAAYINAVYGYHRAVAQLEAAVGRPLRQPSED